MSTRPSSTIRRDIPDHLQDGPPQRCPSGGAVDLAGAEKHWVVGDHAHGGRRRKEMVQIPAGDRAELLLQVGPLRLGQACSHRQPLQRNPVPKHSYQKEPTACSNHPSDGVEDLTCR